MSVCTEYPSAPWLVTLLRRFERGEHDEVSALANYYPTPASVLVRCAALLVRGRLKELNSSFRTLRFDSQDLPADLPRLLAATGIDCHALAREAVANSQPYAGRLCLEFHLVLHPEAAPAVCDDLITIASKFFYWDLMWDCLNRVVALDGSPTQLIQCAELALEHGHRPKANKEFARALLLQALDRLSEEDVETRMKIMGLLVSRTSCPFDEIQPILEGMLQVDGGLRERVANLLLPRVYIADDYEPIAWFLIEIDARNIDRVLDQLVERRIFSRRSDLLAKAQALLDARDYIALGFAPQYARARLAMGRLLEEKPALTLFALEKLWLRCWRSMLAKIRALLPFEEKEPSSPDPCELDMRKANMEEMRKVNKPSPPSVAVERYTRVVFPIECVQETKADLIVQLTREAPAESRAAGKVAATASPDETQVTLDVHVSAPAFAIHKSHQPMVVPVEGDSQEITFTLFPVEVGEQVIEIEFFQGSVRVGYVLVKAQVLPRWTEREESGQEKPAGTLQVLVPESPRAGIAARADWKFAETRRTLHVSWSEKEGKLTYTLYSGTKFGDIPEWHVSTPGLRGEIETYLRQLNAYLSEVVVQGSPTEKEWDSLLLNLRGYGFYLFQQLVPAALAKEMKRWRTGATFLITTDEQWIPWELLYNGKDFWGERYIFGRYPRLGDRCYPQDARPHENLRQIRRLINVVGGDVLEKEEKRAERLFEGLLPAEAIEFLLRKPLAALRQTLDKADALHCTCHCCLEPLRLQIAEDSSQGANLLLNSVQLLPIKPGCLVFANACASDHPVLTFGQFNTFGWEFYKRGVGTFIGTLGDVPTTHAISFAEIFYRELLQAKGRRTIGQALTAAKKASAKKRNIFWLLYCLYGDPDFAIAS